MSPPLVSICIPTYNNSAYIAETLRSVFSQTYSNFEVLIVDDDSTDDTAEIIRTFKDTRITFHVNSSNLGMHGNWSKALSLARGEYIKLLCGDDLIDPDCIEKQLAAFCGHSSDGLAMVTCRRRILSSNGKTVGGAFYKLPPGIYSGEKAVRYCVAAGTNLIGEPMAVLFSGEIYRSKIVQPGSNNYMIDFDLYTKLLRHGRLLMMRERLAGFRIHDKSMTGTLGMKHARMFVEFISDEEIGQNFGIRWYHRLSGRMMAYVLTIVRNLIIRAG